MLDIIAISYIRILFWVPPGFCNAFTAFTTFTTTR